MTLSTGTNLGPYQVLAQIGAGGMGEVYRARDTRLKRDIAIKILPDAWARDTDRRERFRREAELLATLNHPNIAAIYGVEESPEIEALLLELVDGPTLADRLASGSLPVSDALAIARQIVDALEAAHEHGIVHRDLKPANIKLKGATADIAGCTVKILDFGIAKALASDDASALVDAANSPTITSPARTQAGIILGTAAYMSPEQARGRAVDKRSDIWAFGCVLYEMLSGHKAFSGPTVTDTLAAILERQPDWTALPATTPPLVVRLLRRCLEKDVRRRVHDIADARLDLDDAEDALPAAVTDARKRGRVAWITAAALTLAGVATIAAVWAFTRGGHTPTPEPLRFTITLQPGEELPMDAGLPPPVAISRDGRSIVYVTRGSTGNRIYLRRRDDIDGKPIAGTEGGAAPFLSPDGRWLGFASGGFLRKVPIVGGTPQNITTVSNMFSATWSDEGSIVFHAWSGGLFKVDAMGGTPSELTRIGSDGGEAHQVPYALPGGRSVLFAVFQAGTAPAIELLDLSAGTRKRLLEGSDPHYLSSGHLVFTRAGRLYTAPFDLKRLEVTGSATPVSDEIAVTVVQGRGALAVAENGTIVYVPAASNAGRLVLVDANGSVRSAGEGFDQFRHPRFSPDGTRFVTWVQSASGISEVWVYDLTRKTRVRLTVTGAVSRPIWSPDGRNITFQKDGSIYTMPADDSGPATVLLERDPQALVFPLAWSRDGRVLVYSRPAPETNRDVYVLSTGGKPTPFLVTTRDERAAMLSPDGHWMVYAALEAGREEEVYVQRYPGPGDRIPVSVGGGREPVWSPAGGEIFYRSIDGQRMMAATVRAEPTLSVGRPRVIFQGLFQQGTFWSEYRRAPKDPRISDGGNR